MSERGTGETSRQMRAAAQGAVFIWCNSHTDYPRRLAEHLGRKDIRIFPPSALEAYLRGLEPSAVVVDHAAKLTERQWEMLMHLRRVARPA
jgi:hypothetical protein